jgi:hypothetical protein
MNRPGRKRKRRGPSPSLIIIDEARGFNFDNTVLEQLEWDRVMFGVAVGRLNDDGQKLTLERIPPRTREHAKALAEIRERRSVCTDHGFEDFASDRLVETEPPPALQTSATPPRWWAQ